MLMPMRTANHKMTIGDIALAWPPPTNRLSGNICVSIISELYLPEPGDHSNGVNVDRSQCNQDHC